MKIKLLQLIKLALVLSVMISSSQTRKFFEDQGKGYYPFAAAIWIDENGGLDTFYNNYYFSPNDFPSQNTNNSHAIHQDLSRNFATVSFGNHSYGSNDLIIKGAEIKTFKAPGANVCGGSFYYRTYIDDGSIKPSFTEVQLGFYKNCNLDGMGGGSFEDGLGPCNDNPGYQKWQASQDANSMANIDLTSQPEGEYVLEIYYKIWGSNTGGCNGGDVFANNDGANYKSSFTICPTISGGGQTNPIACGGNGTITLNVQGLPNGSYDGSFYYGAGLGTPFTDVVVENNVATISNVVSGTYENIRYRSATGTCGDIGNENRTLVDPVPPVIPFENNLYDHEECEESPIQTLNANTYVPEVSGFTYVWYDAPTEGNLIMSPTLSQVGSVTYYAAAVSDETNCEGGDRAAVQLTIKPTPDEPIFTTNCDLGDGKAILTVQLVEGETIEYSLDEGPFQTSNVFNDVVNGNHTLRVRNTDNPECIRYFTQSTINVTCDCVGGPTLDITPTTGETCGVLPYDFKGSFKDATQVEITTNGSGVLTGNDGVGGVIEADLSGKLVLNISSFEAIYTPGVADVGKDVLITVSTDNPKGGECKPATTVITLKVNELPEKPDVIDLGGEEGGQTECAQNPIQTLNANDSIEVEAGKTIVWYDAEEGGNIVLQPILNYVGTITYYAASIDKTTECEGDLRAKVILTIKDANPIEIEEEDKIQEFCKVAEAVVADLKAKGENIKWYLFETGGTALDLSDLLVDGVTYYGTQDNGECESSIRTAVLVEITDTKKPDTPADLQEFCEKTNPMLLDIDIDGSDIKWYDAEVDGELLNNTMVLEDDTTYFASQSLGDGTCESSERTAVTINLRCGIIANDDAKVGVNGLDGTENILNVFTNDSFNGVVINPVDINNGDITLDVIQLDPSGALTLNADGSLDIASNTKVGTYQLEYQICEASNNTTNCDTAIVVVTVQALVDMSIEKNVSAPVQLPGKELKYYVDDVVTFSLKVKNNSIDSANNVVVEDVLPDGYTYVSDNSVTVPGTYDLKDWTIGTVGPGVEYVLQIDARINPKGNYVNMACVSADETDPIETNDCDTADLGSDPPVAVADLRVEYTISDNEPNVNNYVTLTVVVHNDGPSDAAGVVLKDLLSQELLPKGYSYVSSSTSTLGSDYNNESGVWSIGEMNSGGKETLIITAEILPLEENEDNSIYTTTASVEVATYDPDMTNNSVTLFINPKQRANLAVQIKVDNSTPYVGEEVVFELFFENLGPSIATDIMLTEILPDGYTYVSHEFEVVESNGVKTQLPESSFVFDETTGSGVWNTATMVPSTDVSSPKLYITAIVNPIVDSIKGDDVKIKEYYTSIAEVWANEETPPTHPDHLNNLDSTNNIDQVYPTILKSADLSIKKVVAGGNTNPDVGTNITFTLTAQNLLPLSDATGVYVIDKLPSGYEYVSHTSGEDYDPTTGEWKIGDLEAVTGSATIDIVAKVNVSGDYTNTAEVFGNEHDPDNGNNKDQVTPIGNPNADLSVEIITPLPNTTVKLYDKVVYTIKAQNNGLSVATDVEATIKLPEAFTFVSSDANFDPVTGVWDIGGLDVTTYNADGTIAIDNSVNLIITGVIDGVIDTKKSAEIEISANIKGKEDDNFIDNNDDVLKITYVPDCEVRVYNFVSANGDGKNDYLKIDNLECYSYSKVKIYNRWGSLVYDVNNYESTDNNNGRVFKGQSTGSGTVSGSDLPSGTYFYILKYNNGSDDIEQTGYIQLTR